MKDNTADNLDSLDEISLRQEKLRMEIRGLTDSPIAQPSFWFSTISTSVAILSALLMVVRTSGADTARRIQMAQNKWAVNQKVQKIHDELRKTEQLITEGQAKLKQVMDIAIPLDQKTRDAEDKAEQLQKQIDDVNSKLTVMLADKDRMARIAAGLTKATDGLVGESASTISGIASSIKQAINNLSD